METVDFPSQDPPILHIHGATRGERDRRAMPLVIAKMVMSLAGGDGVPVLRKTMILPNEWKAENVSIDVPVSKREAN
jgi:hypothetical protein